MSYGELRNFLETTHPCSDFGTWLVNFQMSQDDKVTCGTVSSEHGHRRRVSKSPKGAASKVPTTMPALCFRSWPPHEESEAYVVWTVLSTPRRRCEG